MSDFDHDLEATLRGRLAGGTLNIVNEALDTLDGKIERQMLDAMRQGPITADQATQAWYHKFAIHELRLKLNQTASQGQSASRRIAPLMTESLHGQAQ